MFNHEKRQIQSRHEVGNHGKHIFTTEFTEDTEVKRSQRIAAGDSRNNSLTQCIIFISFMNFMVKKAVLCVLCGEKCIYLVF